MRSGLLLFVGWVVLSAGQSSAQTSPAALSVDPTSREESRQFFRTLYGRSAGVAPRWTGLFSAGNAGDTAAAFKEAARLRVAFFRALAGVPADVTLNSAYSAKAQQAALMLSANQQVSAAPPASWIFFTPAGAEAAANANLGLGRIGAEAITAYVRGDGEDGGMVASRRWLLYPWTRAIGLGDVPAAGTGPAANATWVRDTVNFTGTRPATRDPYVAWPPRGYVPYPLVFPRWSLAYPGADFSGAVVAMARGGVSVPVRQEPLATGAGENTLVWVYDHLDARLPQSHPRPTEDVTFQVTISGVRGAGVPTGFSYAVTVFDPDEPGADALPATVNGSVTPAAGQPNSYNLFRQALADGHDWRSLQFTAASPVFGAEGDLQGVVADTTGSYAVRDSTRRSAGASAYRLAHETAEPQFLSLPGLYFSPMGAAGELSFRSWLVGATGGQTARVEVSVDGGSSWREAFSQSGGGGAEAGFRQRVISLADYAGRTIQVRFVFDVDGIRAPGAADGAGWYLDEIALSGVRMATMASSTRVGVAPSFRVTPGAAGPLGLQGRGVLAGAYPMEWGPVLQVVAVGADGAGDPGRLTNLAIRTRAGTGAQTLIMGVSIGGTGTAGSKTLLMRGVGPSLERFDVSDVLENPILTVLSGSTVLTANDNWDNNSQVAEVTPQVGAFPLVTPTSRDAALVTVRPAGSYTVQIAGVAGTTGTALAEVYDVLRAGGFTATTPRLVNVSARAQVGAGGDVLIAGFSIGGSTEKNILIRAAGPALGAFGVEGFLVDPKLELYSGAGQLLTTNDNWVPSTHLTQATESVGAFALRPGSRDAALLITLPPGSYSAQVSGVGGTGGVGLVEVYEIP